MSNQFLDIELTPVNDINSEMKVSLTRAVRDKGLVLSVTGAGIFENNVTSIVELDKVEAQRLIEGLTAFINNEVTATGCEKL